MSNLKQEESDAIRSLQDSGLPLAVATLAVVMFTRRHVRPESELIAIVSQYPNLEDKLQTPRAIAMLRNMGWLVTVDLFGQTLTKAAQNLQDLMGQQIGNPGLIRQLEQLRLHLTPAPYVRILGNMDENVFGTFLDLLGSAQHEICLPMLTTTPYTSTVAILQDRARRGVHVRILLGSPKVAVKLRGGIAEIPAREAIAGWARIAQSVPKIEVRIAHIPEDMYFATSWTLDGKLLRFDIYDPSRQRSLDGYMLEVDSRHGFAFNLVTLFQERFELAWNRAQPIHAHGRIRWFLATHWQWAAFVATGLAAVALAAFSETLVWSEIIASVSATFLFNALVSSWPIIRSAIHRRTQ